VVWLREVKFRFQDSLLAGRGENLLFGRENLLFGRGENLLAGRYSSNSSLEAQY